MLIDLLVAILILGLVVFLVRQFLPEPFRSAAIAVCVVILIVWLLQIFRFHPIG